MTAREITDILCRTRWNPRRHLLVPNVSWGLGIDEADLLVVFPSGWAEEVEIKVSKADFKREFIVKVKKHDELNAGKPVYDWKQEGCQGRTQHCIHKYWMAMPIALAEAVAAEIPDHAGLIGIDPNGNCWSKIAVVLKEAPILSMSRKLTPAEQSKVLRLAYLRYWDLRKKVAA